MTPPVLVGPLLQIFFTEYLVAQKRLSVQTIASYRDTFRLLLQFVHRETGIEPSALPVATLDADRVLAFLEGLGERPPQRDHVSEPAPHGHPIILSHGRTTRARHGRPRHSDPRHSDETHGYEGARLRHTRGNGRRARQSRSDAVVRTTRSRPAADDVQHRRAGLRDRHAPPRARHRWSDQLPPVAGQGPQGTVHSALAQDRADLAGLVSGDPRAHRHDRVSRD